MLLRSIRNPRCSTSLVLRFRAVSLRFSILPQHAFSTSAAAADPELFPPFEVAASEEAPTPSIGDLSTTSTDILLPAPTPTVGSGMEVTTDNFSAALPIVLDAIAHASFVAIDAEFTGLHTESWVKAVSLDTIDSRHARVRNSAANFKLLQYGVCCFSFDAATGAWVARPFAFYLHPREIPLGLDREGGKDDIGTMSSGALTFLSSNHFDFNKTFAKGISWLSAEAEAAIRAERRAAAVWKLSRSFSAPAAEDAPAPSPPASSSASASAAAAPEAAAAAVRVLFPPLPEGPLAPRPCDIIIRSPLDVEWYKSTLAAVTAWIARAQAWEGAGAAPAAVESAGLVSSDALQGAEVSPDGAAAFPYFILSPANGFRRRVLYTMATELSKAAGASAGVPRPFLCWQRIADQAAPGVNDWNKRLRLTWVGARAEPYIAFETKRALVEVDDLVTEAVGFRHVIDAITKRGCLVVGHNCQLDFVHSTAKFVGKTGGLPSDVCEWSAVLLNLFPGGVIDTKMLATGPLGSVFGNSTGLGQVFERVQSRGTWVLPQPAASQGQQGLAKQPRSTGAPPPLPNITAPAPVASPSSAAISSFTGGGVSSTGDVGPVESPHSVASPQPLLLMAVEERSPMVVDASTSTSLAVDAPSAAAGALPVEVAPATAPSTSTLTTPGTLATSPGTAPASAARADAVEAAAQTTSTRAPAVAAGAAAAGAPANGSNGGAANGSIAPTGGNGTRKRGRYDDSSVAPPPSVSVDFPALANVVLASRFDRSQDEVGASSSSSAAATAPAAGAAAASSSSPPIFNFGAFAHDAGADAAMTGIVFLRCAALMLARVEPAVATSTGAAATEGGEAKNAKLSLLPAPAAAAVGEESSSAAAAAAASTAVAAAPTSTSELLGGSPPPPLPVVQLQLDPASRSESADVTSAMNKQLSVSDAAAPARSSSSSSSSPSAVAVRNNSGGGGSAGAPPPPPAFELKTVAPALINDLLLKLERKGTATAAAAAEVEVGSGAQVEVPPALRAVRSVLYQMRTAAAEHKSLNVEDAADVWSAGQGGASSSSLSTSNSVLLARAAADLSSVLSIEGVNHCIDTDAVIARIASLAGIAPHLIDKRKHVTWVDDRSLFITLPSRMHVDAVVEAWDAGATLLAQEDGDEAMEGATATSTSDGGGDNMLGIGAHTVPTASPSATAADAEGVTAPRPLLPGGPEYDYAAALNLRMESYAAFLKRNAHVFSNSCDGDVRPKATAASSSSSGGGAAAAAAAAQGAGGKAAAEGGPVPSTAAAAAGTGDAGSGCCVQ